MGELVVVGQAHIIRQCILDAVGEERIEEVLGVAHGQWAASVDRGAPRPRGRKPHGFSRLPFIWEDETCLVRGFGL